MRSVVVVLPASICAMIPMFRTLSIATGRSCIFSATLISLSVPEVGESLVAFRHPMGFFLALDSPASVLGGVKDLERELLGHAFPAPLAGETHDPAAREGEPALRANLDRYLVRGATDAARFDLEQRRRVAKRRLEHLERLLLGLLARPRKGVVDHALGGRALAFAHDHVHELGDRLRLVDRVGRDDTLDWTAAARHQAAALLFSRLAPYSPPHEIWRFRGDPGNVRRLRNFCLLPLCPVLTACLLAVLGAGCVQGSANDVVA